MEHYFWSLLLEVTGLRAMLCFLSWSKQQAWNPDSGCGRWWKFHKLFGSSIWAESNIDKTRADMMVEGFPFVHVCELLKKTWKGISAKLRDFQTKLLCLIFQSLHSGERLAVKKRSFVYICPYQITILLQPQDFAQWVNDSWISLFPVSCVSVSVVFFNFLSSS